MKKKPTVAVFKVFSMTIRAGHRTREVNPRRYEKPGGMHENIVFYGA